MKSPLRAMQEWLGRQATRQSDLYPRLMRLGGLGGSRKTPLIKPSPTNLRYFARTPVARRAINTIKNPIKNMEWAIVPKRGITENREIKRQIAQMTACFCAPNTDDSFGTMIEKIVEDYLVASAGCFEQQVDSENQLHPLWMWPVDSQSIQIYPLWQPGTDEPRYRQTLGTGTVSLESASIQLRDDELVYIAPNPSTNTPYGYGPLEITATMINRALGAAEFAGNVASNAQPANLLWLGDVDDGDIQTFRQYWKNEVEGQGMTPLIGGPNEPAAVRLTGADDAGLYLKWQEFLVRMIATGFDLSVTNFNVGDGAANKDNTDSAAERDWETAVKPMAMTLADYVNRKSIMGRLGYTQIEFQFVGLDREEEEAQADIHEKQYQNNIITPNEARAQLGMELSDNPYADMLYADVQVAIGEARRGGVTDTAPDKLHNLPPKKLRKLR